jgi:UDP-N-acetylmuramate-alanine ligase
VFHIATLAECEAYLQENIERDEIVVLMGAGDVFRVGENLVE